MDLYEILVFRDVCSNIYWVSCVRFEVFRVLTMKNVMWDVNCHPLQIHQCFRGIYCHHLQGWKVSYVSNQQEVGSEQSKLHD
jgi:hypothetical protein